MQYLCWDQDTFPPIHEEVGLTFGHCGAGWGGGGHMRRGERPVVVALSLHQLPTSKLYWSKIFDDIVTNFVFFLPATNINSAVLITELLKNLGENNTLVSADVFMENDTIGKITKRLTYFLLDCNKMICVVRKSLHFDSSSNPKLLIHFQRLDMIISCYFTRVNY